MSLPTFNARGVSAKVLLLLLHCGWRLSRIPGSKHAADGKCWPYFSLYTPDEFRRCFKGVSAIEVHSDLCYWMIRDGLIAYVGRASAATLKRYTYQLELTERGRAFAAELGRAIDLEAMP